MRSSKVMLALPALTAICCAAVFAAQSTPAQHPQHPQQAKQEKSTTGSMAAKDIVVVDVSSQLSPLKDQKANTGKKVASVPIDLTQASGYRQGLDLVAFRLSGTLDRADAKTPPGEAQPTTTSEKGSGSVILQAIVSPRSDLTYEDVMRIANRGPEKLPGELRDVPQKAGATQSSDNAGAAVLCECRTSSIASGAKGRTFEIVGYAPLDASHVSSEMMADIKRRLTETSAAAGKSDPASPGAAVGAMAAEPRPQDVKQALDSIEKGKAYLYINLVPEMAMPGRAETDATGSTGEAGPCTLKDITLTFAALPRSSP